LLAIPHSLIWLLSDDAQAARNTNQAEAQQTVELVATLHAAGLALAEIGIVSPFRAQGARIRKALRARFGPAAQAITADTVERMQGQERDVIIISLTSNDPAYLHRIGGFFYQPQRLNVSITRARSKLFILASQQVLKVDSHHATLSRWITELQSLLQTCHPLTWPDP
jgi:DNA replication ATP-dependent helicase Dna2